MNALVIALISIIVVALVIYLVYLMFQPLPKPAAAAAPAIVDSDVEECCCESYEDDGCHGTCCGCAGSSEDLVSYSGGSGAGGCIEHYVPSADLPSTKGHCKCGPECACKPVCHCDRLSSDLSDFCRCGQSNCRYPITLPEPEPSYATVPLDSCAKCSFSTTCGKSTCLDALKFGLQ